MRTTQTPSPRPTVGQPVRVIAPQSERRGETGTVRSISDRGIVDVDMEAGDRAQWPLFELSWTDWPHIVFPCQQCGAVTGEPCREWCTAR